MTAATTRIEQSRVVQAVAQLGAGAAAGLAGGIGMALLQALTPPPAAVAKLMAQALLQGLAAGLACGAFSLLLPSRDRPGALIDRWLHQGPAGPGDRALGLLVSTVALFHLLWAAGAWVDSTFHHRLLSAALLTVFTFAAMPPALVLLRWVERLSGRRAELGLLLLLLVGASLGLRLALAPSTGALHRPLVLSSGLLEGLACWTLVQGRLRLCLVALLVSPLAFLLALVLSGQLLLLL